MDRNKVFHALARMGIGTITGPTYSISGETASNPASHNLTMFLRHHRYCSEAANTGLQVIPNVYWRNADDRSAWVKWLDDNPEVAWISRDFSRTKQWVSFEAELAGLIGIIKLVARPISVVVLGVGAEKMLATHHRLAEVGARISFVSSSPIVRPPVGVPAISREDAIRNGIREHRRLASGFTSRVDDGNGLLAMELVVLKRRFVSTR